MQLPESAKILGVDLRTQTGPLLARGMSTQEALALPPAGAL
jgi:hypothetical protein